jgi:hypothetical protein
MILRRLAIILAVMTMAFVASAQTNAPGPVPSVHIVAPKAGEKLSANFVTVRYELLNPGASANTSPTYSLRLDGHDPVTTSDTEYTFSGLAPGSHSVIIEMVDSNGTPINGTRAEVHFVVNPQPQPTEAIPDHTDIVRQTTASLGQARLVRAIWQQPDKHDRQAPAHPRRAPEQLPHSSTALPLLSLIGLGVLAGGLVSAWRTR